ncbi:MAG: sugar 3,4-ketoisomerase [Flavobacteriia bacterium]
MDKKKSPHLVEYPKIGGASLGYISVAEAQDDFPFEIKRVYWTYYTPNEVTRGGHAHKKLEQIIFAVSGSILFDVEDANGSRQRFELDEPHLGLYLPPFTWREIKFSHNAVLLCLASELFDEADYIRNYSEYTGLLLSTEL